MRSNRSSGFHRDPEWNTDLNSSHEPTNWDPPVASSNSADEVFGELGLILVVVLGVVLAINMMLVALHIS